MVIKKRCTDGNVKAENPEEPPMDVSLNPNVEKNWRRLLVSVLLEVAKTPNGVPEKPPKGPTKTELKRQAADARILEKAKYVEYRKQIMDAKDDTTEQFKKYERLTVEVLLELCMHRRVAPRDSLGETSKKKPLIIMALMQDDQLIRVKKACEGDSSSSSGPKKEVK